MRAPGQLFAVSRGAHRAFSMAEVIISLGLVGGLLVVSLNTVSGASLGRRQLSERGAGSMLAAALMTEILQQNYTDPEAPSTVLGIDASEVGDGSRLLFDDVDDYHGLSEAPPKLRKGQIIQNRSTWARSVAVDFVNPLNVMQVSLTDQGLKRIVVTVKRDGEVLARLTALRFGVAVPGAGFDLNLRLPVDYD